MNKKTIASALLVAGLAGAAQAQLIAADSYNTSDYAAGGLNGQNPNINPGWTGAGSAAWSVGSANLQADSISLTNGATAYDDASDGKGKYIASSTDFYRAGHHRVDTYTHQDTYYMSFFVNSGGVFNNTSGREHAVVGFTNFFNEGAFENSNTDNVFGLFAGFRGEAAGAAADSKDLILRARGATGDLEDTVLIADVADNTTYHVIYKLVVNASGGTDQVDYWVNPADLSNEGSLTSSAAASGSVGTFSMDTNTRIDRSFVVTNNWSASYFWDETRFGYDLDSVTGVPAPGAIAMLGLGGLAATRRRR
ncbi:MAG: PEP-CTERM sorting domain-containing protein [Phycisphaerales bacterium]